MVGNTVSQSAESAVSSVPYVGREQVKQARDHWRRSIIQVVVAELRRGKCHSHVPTMLKIRRQSMPVYPSVVS